MNANQVKNMVTRVPTIRKSVDLKSFCVSEFNKTKIMWMQTRKGADLRFWFAGLVILPIAAAGDANGGLFKLGFSTGT